MHIHNNSANESAYHSIFSSSGWCAFKESKQMISLSLGLITYIEKHTKAYYCPAAWVPCSVWLPVGVGRKSPLPQHSIPPCMACIALR
jgi:hypothetical protein